MDDNQRPLRLLSLGESIMCFADSTLFGKPDGGGIRGLSSLYILKRIMMIVQKKREGSTQDPLYPHECFDLIAGTSTGG